MAYVFSTSSYIPKKDNNDVGYRAKTLVLTEELLSDKRLSLIEKLVLSYYEQIAPYAAEYDSCSMFLDISQGDADRAKTHLSEMGYIELEVSYE